LLSCGCVQLYETQRAANDVLRKELQQVKQDRDKMRSDVEVAKAVAAASESSSQRTDAALAVRIQHCLIIIIIIVYYARSST